MLVWQEGESGLRDRGEPRSVAARGKGGLPARLLSYAQTATYISRPFGRQLSREARVALEYALAIGSALGMSWLLLRLGL